LQKNTRRSKKILNKVILVAQMAHDLSGGTGTLQAGGIQIAQGQIKRAVPIPLTLDEGLDVGIALPFVVYAQKLL
jgi:hypothetical protein